MHDKESVYIPSNGHSSNSEVSSDLEKDDGKMSSVTKNGYHKEVLDYIMVTATNINDEFENLNKKYALIYNMLDKTYERLVKMTDHEVKSDPVIIQNKPSDIKPNINDEIINNSTCSSNNMNLMKYFPKSLEATKKQNVTILNINENVSQESLGTYTRIKYDLMKTVKYTVHTCTPHCLSYFSKDPKYYQSDISILYIPIQTGWNRMLRNTKVIYISPCGLVLTKNEQLLEYLLRTASCLPIDYFSFSENLDITRNFEATASIIDDDITNNKEKLPISCVNSFDFTYPSDFTYSPVAIPMDEVKISNDPGFLCSCTCEDLCQDRSKCQCQMLTHEGASKIGMNQYIPGYIYRRLPQPLGTGIYECNSTCHCKRQCLNRVVQNGVKYKLQLFKTKDKGWGIRCLNDIPLGTFVCTYTGRILTDKNAELNGYQDGDEYLAQIDFIECAENLKEEYAEKHGLVDPDRVANFDKMEMDSYPSYPSQIARRSGFSSSRSFLNIKSTPNSPIMAGTSNNMFINNYFNENPNTKFINCNGTSNGKRKTKYTRTLFDGERKCYVMDAKREGNIGRYFNHSCDPNLFVQNVFIDAHDIRFPVIALFANRCIIAGQELTWNYGYEVGSVKGKEIVCNCLSDKCNGRLI